MKLTLEELQEAFISEMITVEQFIQVLKDNFGTKRTRKILRKNLELAMRQAKQPESSHQARSLVSELRQLHH